MYVIRERLYAHPVLLFEVELTYGTVGRVAMRQAGQSKKMAEARLSFEERKAILNTVSSLL